MLLTQVMSYIDRLFSKQIIPPQIIILLDKLTVLDRIGSALSC